MIHLSVADAAALREPVPFRHTWDVGIGRSVYVVGNHPDLGDWDPVRSIRLNWTPGNVWTGHIGLPAGTEIEYKFIARTNSIGAHCDPQVEWMPGPNLTTNVPPAPPAPYAGKTIYYRSTWTNVGILYRSGEQFVGVPMQRIGEGRTPAESLYRIDRIGTVGAPLEFAMYGYQDNIQHWDNAPYPGYGDNNYYTELDVFYLQDQHVFNYLPPATLSPPRIFVTNVASSVAGIAERRVRILLPRGYDENTWKRYPVLYLHDGQNVYDPGGAFGSWSIDVHAPREISQGRMREAILVAIDNTDERLAEYCPPGDSAVGETGIADRYTQFVVDNVRPTIDTHFRTLNTPEHTLVMGSSMGGLVSLYMGVEGGGVFGKVGALSSSFWTAPNFVARLAETAGIGLRVYLDAGTAEGESVWNIWDAREQLMHKGYAEHMDLWTVIECGATHSEGAWNGRFPAAARYLLNLRDEANRLAHHVAPVQVGGLLSADAETWTVPFGPALHGWLYTLDRSASLIQPEWVALSTTHVERLPWQAQHTLAISAPVDAGSGVYRISARAE
jgi:predicted alpha/beta superfamily hydrolase